MECIKGMEYVERYCGMYNEYGICREVFVSVVTSMEYAERYL
jgi:glutamate mutase epsilon subunit